MWSTCFCRHCVTPRVLVISFRIIHIVGIALVRHILGRCTDWCKCVCYYSFLFIPQHRPFFFIYFLRSCYTYTKELLTYSYYYEYEFEFKLLFLRFFSSSTSSTNKQQTSSSVFYYYIFLECKRNKRSLNRKKNKQTDEK